MNTTMNEYEVTIRPTFDENLCPVYRMILCHNSADAVSGPISNGQTFYDVDDMDGWLEGLGFRRTGWIVSHLSDNGFATVRAERI